MEYYVRQEVDVRTGRESWALLDARCMPERKDSELCVEEDVKATASSRPELELKMARLGLSLGGAGRTYMISGRSWTTWSVSEEGERTDG